MANSTTTTIPIIICGAVVIGGVGLLARGKLRRKTADLAEVDLSADEWHAAVEFEHAGEGKSG